MAFSEEITEEPTTDNLVIANFSHVKLVLLVIPILFLVVCFVYFAIQGDFTNTYITNQKGLFLKLNHNLSVYTILANNITQLGNALVAFSFIFFLIFISPKFWQVIITVSVFSLITSAILKKIFAVPRPAAVLDMCTFTVIGKPNILHTSLPSGHAMTGFMVITILLFAFLPKKKLTKVLWSMFFLLLGIVIAFSRVAVGAHYPLDVVIGCAIGFILAIISIKVNVDLKWLYWINNRKVYPFIFIILCLWMYLIVLKIMKYNLAIFYISLFALIITFVFVIKKYAKKIKP